MAISARIAILAAVVTAAQVLTACGINVQKDDNGRTAKVDIHSPMGNVSVKANSDTPPDTGLPVHRGARAMRNGHDDNANVSIDSGFFGVNVIVAKFADDAAPDDILAFYRKELAAHGAVMECHGNVDFHGRSGNEPVCKPQASSRETQLVVGTEGDHRVVSVKPRGSGTEFSLVHVQTRG